MNYYFQYLIIRFAAFLLNCLPASFAFWCARRTGELIFSCMAGRREVALQNIRNAFGDALSEADKRRYARAAFQSMILSVTELFIIDKIKRSTGERFTLSGKEHLEGAFGQGKGIVLVISHLGSWEYLSFLPYITGKQWTVIVKDVRNPYLNRYIKRLRKLTTVVPIEKNNSMRTILKELKSNHGVAILIDQWAGADGIWIDFFGVKTSTTSIPARLAQKTGCVLIPAYCLRKASGKYEIHIHPRVPFHPEDENWEAVTTAKLNERLEEQIRKHPDQWLWAHRRWKKKPNQMREV